MDQSSRRVVEISFEWKRWAAATLLSGRSVEAVVERMTEEGFDADEASHACKEVLASPGFAAGEWASQRLRKLESMLDALRTLRALGETRSCDRTRGLSSKTFLQQYYASNTPVVLEDVSTGWGALTAWGPAHFTEVMGDEVVEVMADRDADPEYERRAGSHRRRISLREYVDRLDQPSNDYYLVANNHLLETDAAAPLWRDFAVDARYLDPTRTAGSVFLWLGPQGTLTPLHHDVQNVLFVQVLGRKKFTLVSPLESHCVSNNMGVFSDVDVRAPDLARHPRFATTHAIELEVSPGEALFIPVGWWHCVEALDVSASLSFTNFRYPNSFTWAHPDVVFST